MPRSDVFMFTCCGPSAMLQLGKNGRSSGDFGLWPPSHTPAATSATSTKHVAHARKDKMAVSNSGLEQRSGTKSDSLSKHPGCVDAAEQAQQTFSTYTKLSTPSIGNDTLVRPVPMICLGATLFQCIDPSPPQENSLSNGCTAVDTSCQSQTHPTKFEFGHTNHCPHRTTF